MSKLQFRADDTFTIVQFTDIHWKNGDAADMQSRALMECVLDQEKPDFVVFTGDVIDSKGCKNPGDSYRNAVESVVRRNLPWAAVFGNHDTEAGVTRQELMALQQERAGCLSRPGPELVTGIGNYVLTINGHASNEAKASLYFLDSGSYAPGNVGGYDWIRRDQIDWYARESTMRTQRNGKLPALAFFHIPLPEYNDVWDFEACYGLKREDICCPKVNSGFFASLVEMGEVIGTFVGHDHINDFCGTLHGVKLCYGRATGYNTYGKEGFSRGARIILLKQGERSFSSWLRLANDSVDRQETLHKPQGRTLAVD